ncbi:MAG: iron-regulated protein [Rubrivivax sp.]|nr:MAG: iron-regulated protein [Rubrivivax sp.]
MAALLAGLFAALSVASSAAAQNTAAAAATGAASSAAAPSASSPATITPQAVVRHHGALVHAAYSDTAQAAAKLQDSIQAFVAAPSAERLQAARQAWLNAREWYGQTEAFRFYGGPIDDARGPESRLNAWPMDEAFVDSVAGKPGAGLVNNRKVKIDLKTLAGYNERDGEENIATGWHAIEFLLWGQDTSETGPGNRPATDYIDGQAPNADRRRQYLTVVSELLVSDLRLLVAAWAPDNNKNYRARFDQGGLESVRKIFVGLGSLSRGELAGERLEVALASQDQEDEHSCFSDNTHRDAVTNAQGIENVWLGRWTHADGRVLQGPGLRDLVASKDAAVAERTTAQIAASVAAAKAIQAPFDREIIGGQSAPGPQRIRATITSLTQQSRDLVAAANAVGIQKLTLVQP